MHSGKLSVLLLGAATAGSALSWWPLCISPSLDLPFWLPLVVIAFLTGLSTILSGGRWLRFVIASAVATFAGILSGYMIWPIEDGIAASYTPIVIVVATLAAALVSLLVGLATRWISVSHPGLRLALWIAAGICVAFGPIALALTPPLVAQRVARNDRLAEQRFLSLNRAVQQTVAEPGGQARLCDGHSLKSHYSGPPFSDRDWQYIAGNYVREDGYVFGINIYCSDPNRYSIDVRPSRGKADGTRQFCTDPEGRAGCETK